MIVRLCCGVTMWNTQRTHTQPDQRVELYDGNAWGSIAGSSGAVSIIDATEIAVEYALALG